MTTGQLPSNWTGQASKSLRARVRDMVNNALEHPDEWAYLPPLKTRVCYRPRMKHPYDGSLGLFEAYIGPYQAPFKTMQYPHSNRSGLEESLFRSCTGELRSEGGRLYQDFVEGLIVDDELDHLY